MIIALDASGGDEYPKPQIEGAIEALKENEDLKILLVGKEPLVKDVLSTYEYDDKRLFVHHAPEVIGMDESPASAIRSKQQSSIVVGNMLHKAGEVNGFVSAGNTGALLAASTFLLGKLDGVLRPTIATPYPTLQGFRLVVDAGANLDLKKEEYFLQFGVMGAVYAEEVMGVSNARIGLLNVGEEEEKGTDLLKSAYKLMSKLDNFVGNVEGRDILCCKADVFVCDGLIGNILLKFGESVPNMIGKLLMSEAKKQNVDEATQHLIYGLLQKAFQQFDPDNVGGIPLLGVKGTSLIGHGSTSPRAIKNLVLNAVRCVEQGVNEKIMQHLSR